MEPVEVFISIRDRPIPQTRTLVVGEEKEGEPYCTSWSCKGERVERVLDMINKNQMRGYMIMSWMYKLIRVRTKDRNVTYPLVLQNQCIFKL